VDKEEFFEKKEEFENGDWYPWEPHIPPHPPHFPGGPRVPRGQRRPPRPHVPFDPLIPPPRFRKHFRPPRIPFTNEDFQNIKHFMILSILNESESGITGYQLQKHYKLPRGTLIHVLDRLEELDYLKTHEDKIEGRAQKFYQLSELGKKYLEDLKENWASRFMMLSEMAPPEKYGHPFHRKNLRSKMMMDIGDLSEKEESIDYFRGMRSRLNSYLKRVKKKQQHLSEIKQIFDELITTIEDMDGFNEDKIKELIEKF
jgi:DNA-binding PadR family transcriptional regulator